MEKIVTKLLEEADIKVGGGRPGDIVVHDKNFYSRLLRQGVLGVGESYMDGEWDSTDLVETANKAFKAKIDFKITKFSLTDYLQMFFARFANMQSIKRSKKVGEEHYDVGNDLYKEMLGESMSYTCGYWRNGAKNLEEAQFAKMDLICRKVGLKAGDKVLDIGSGFGSLLAHAAKHYGAIGVGISVSKAQSKKRTILWLLITNQTLFIFF